MHFIARIGAIIALEGLIIWSHGWFEILMGIFCKKSKSLASRFRETAMFFIPHRTNVI